MANLDLSGIITRICADLKTKFSKVTFEKDATVGFGITVDGTRYYIALPTPYTQLPYMDGTASPGNGTDYARGNHRHPTDTSRQETLVSGTNIKTINGDSILGSGDLTVGGDIIVIPTYTITGQNSMTCDMTFAEVLQAVEDGTCICAAVVGPFGRDYVTLLSYENNASSPSTAGVYFASAQLDEGYSHYLHISHDENGIYPSSGENYAPSPSSTAPVMDGVAYVGDDSEYARADHVHPTDTSRQATLVSGTNIKTVNGNSLLGSGDLTVGSSVEPSSTTPAMDGTAAVGTATTYARADHVHPTDTSRAAASHKHGNISSLGKLSTTYNITEGDKIVVARPDGASGSVIQCSKIQFGTGTATFLANNGTWQAPPTELPSVTSSDDGKVLTVDNGAWTAATPSGGGTTSYTTVTVTLTVAGWSNDSQTVSASPVTTTNDVIVSPTPASAAAWASAGVLCTAQGAGTLTFTCATTPTDALTANVMVLSGGVSSASGEVF